LRLAHFGDIYVARLEIERFLALLARQGGWSRIEFHQYGADWTGRLKAQDAVTVIFHEPQPWSEIVDSALGFDLAVVIGNHDPRTLPSKAVEYLQLPIPRLAVVEDEHHDALAQYVADKPGWIVLRLDGTGSAEAIRDHLRRPWSDVDLVAPEEEQWDRVAAEVVRFFLQIIGDDARPSDQPERTELAQDAEMGQDAGG
jgi:3',5'-cyclic AMP phosphodiesterase CpdA